MKTVILQPSQALLCLHKITSHLLLEIHFLSRFATLQISVMGLKRKVDIVSEKEKVDINPDKTGIKHRH